MLAGAVFRLSSCATFGYFTSVEQRSEEFAALDRYFESPNPQALLIFVADFLRIPTDARRMEMDDKNRFERLTQERSASTAAWWNWLE